MSDPDPTDCDEDTPAMTQAGVDAVYAVLLNVADQLANVRSPWDGEDVDGEAAFFSTTATISEVLRIAVEQARRGQRLTRKMIPSGR